jgi:hypothetical protein
VPARDCSGDRGPGGAPICTPNPDYERAQAELSRIRAVLTETIAALPLLAAERNASDRDPWEQLQAATVFASASPGTPDFERALESARSAMAADIRSSMARFCGDRPPEGMSGNALVQIPELTGAMTRKFPQFNGVQECALRQAENEERLASFTHFLATGGCILGAIATEGALAPACGALGVGMGYAGYVSSRERLYWTERCNAAGGTVCSDTYYAEARSDYDGAVFMLGASVVGAAIDLPILAGQLRAAASSLSSARLSAVATELRAASALTDDTARAASLRRIAGEVAEETAPTTARTAARQRLVDQLGEAAARRRFPCLFR